MSVGRWAVYALLLLLVGVPLSLPGLDATSYGGWPSLGFAIALFLVAGPSRRWQVFLAETVVTTIPLSYSYDVPLLVAALGSLSATLPALLTQHLLTRGRSGYLRLDEVDSTHYHAVTALSALVCGLGAAAIVAPVYSVGDALVAGLMSFLAALTAQQVVLPLMIRTSGAPAAAGTLELVGQRLALVALTLAVFWPTNRLAVAFLVFPLLGWAALRATRFEAHLQLFLVCVTAYAFTYAGHGPLGVSPVDGLPDAFAPAVFYLFVAAAAYLTVPLTLAVERLFSMTSQATRAATTLERLLDAASGTIFIATDRLGRITHYNAGAQHTLGYTPEQVIGLQPRIFHTAEEIARHAADMAVEPRYETVVMEMVRRGDRRDWEFLHVDGGSRMTSLTLSVVTDNDGATVGYIGAGEDITDRLRAEEALVTALDREHASVLRLQEVDHVKQELVSNVSHELRTPITSISGYTELLADGSLGDLTDEQEDAVRRIWRNTSRLGTLVEDLLTLSRAESGQLDLEPDEIDLRDVVHDSLDLLGETLRTRSLQLRRELPEEPVLSLGDRNALERVVTNLVGNAVKFTPDDGTVSVSLSQHGGEVRLVVSDTGMGISAEDQEHLFTRFFRTSTATEQAIQGSGLGLSIVHSIVTSHGGEVVIDSAPGEGTTVTVLLPAYAGRG
jgi:hypothetical protein